MDTSSLNFETRPQGRVFSAAGAQTGYTVVELVVVLVVLGIVAANAMPRFFQVSSFEEMGYADELLGAVRYAHRLELSSRCDTRVSISTTGYAVYQRANSCKSGQFSRFVTRPGAGNWQGSAPNGVAIGTLDLYFDAQGRPHDHASGTLYNNSETVSVGGRTVTVEHTTGYVWAG
jgi:MSHA pilin protein MshC